MESFSDESLSLSYWNYFNVLLLRPFAAILFTVCLLFFGWFLAWKLVLVHVPLVQEIFGLREKIVKPKPPGRGRFIQFYNKINAQNPPSECLEACSRQAIDFYVFGITEARRMPLQEDEVPLTRIRLSSRLKTSDCSKG